VNIPGGGILVEMENHEIKGEDGTVRPFFYGSGGDGFLEVDPLSVWILGDVRKYLIYHKQHIILVDNSKGAKQVGRYSFLKNIYDED